MLGIYASFSDVAKQAICQLLMSVSLNTAFDNTCLQQRRSHSYLTYERCEQTFSLSSVKKGCCTSFRNKNL